MSYRNLDLGIETGETPATFIGHMSQREKYDHLKEVMAKGGGCLDQINQLKILRNSVLKGYKEVGYDYVQVLDRNTFGTSLNHNMLLAAAVEGVVARIDREIEKIQQEFDALPLPNPVEDS